MPALYLLALVLAFGVAAWLQRTVPMPRLYTWLSWGAAAIFALILAPTVWRQPSIETLSQGLLLAVLPLIAVPYQVRMMRLISGSRADRAASAAERTRGPGGGRVRTRDWRR